MLAILAIEEIAAKADGSILPGLLMAAGVLIITAVMMLRLWKMRRRRAGQTGDEAQEQVARNTRANTTNAVGRIESVMVEMQELTKVCAAQVENRVARLEMLLREADARIAELSRLTGAPAETAEPVTPPVTKPERPSRPAIGADELSQRVYSLADSGMTAAQIATELGEHTGKVELILALRQESKRSQASTGSR